jgi:hypothetical protein
MNQELSQFINSLDLYIFTREKLRKLIEDNIEENKNIILIAPHRDILNAYNP